MSLVLYGFRRCPSCQSVFVVAKLLGLELQLKETDPARGDNVKEDFIKLNPNRSLPLLDDGGLLIWDSHAIITYLASKYGSKNPHLCPADVDKRAIIDQMLHFDNGTLYQKVVAYFMPQFREGIIPTDKESDFRSKMEVLQTILYRGGPFVTGEHLTVADICIISTIHIAISCQFDVDNEFPGIGAWIKRVKEQLPFYDQVTASGRQELIQQYRAHFNN